MDLLTERLVGMASPPGLETTELRRQIDRSVSRALFDREYAERLLTDPTIALEDSGCAPQQFRLLRGIQALDIVDFARQAHALFWPADPRGSHLEERLPLAAAR